MVMVPSRSAITGLQVSKINLRSEFWVDENRISNPKQSHPPPHTTTSPQPQHHHTTTPTHTPNHPPTFKSLQRISGAGSFTLFTAYPSKVNGVMPIWRSTWEKMTKVGHGGCLLRATHSLSTSINPISRREWQPRSSSSNLQSAGLHTCFPQVACRAAQLEQAPPWRLTRPQGFYKGPIECIHSYPFYHGFSKVAAHAGRHLGYFPGAWVCLGASEG